MGIRSSAALVCALLVFFAPAALAKQPAEPQLPPNAAEGRFETKGLIFPRCFIHDDATGFYYVANMGGRQLSKKNGGFVSRLNSDGTMENLKFVQGGRDGVTLNSPKGILIDGNNMFISDIDHIAVVDKNTGAFVADVDLTSFGAKYLADMAHGPKGRIYITDTMGNRIFRMDPVKREPELFVESKTLDSPSALVYNAKLDRFLVTLSTGYIGSIDQTGKIDLKFIKVGPRNMVGMDIDAEGNIYVASFTRGKVFKLPDLGKGKQSLAAERLNGPGAIFVDRSTRRLLIPLTLPSKLASIPY